MQVFTTIFLVETLRANIECVEENNGIDQGHPGAIEFKETLKKCISHLEGCDFPAFDPLDQN
ncbi:MAG TPA: hypothetical protein VGI45_26160 [Terracidiphilus sp.]|jgi:hypothetical protein